MNCRFAYCVLKINFMEHNGTGTNYKYNHILNICSFVMLIFTIIVYLLYYFRFLCVIDPNNVLLRFKID